MTAKYAKQTDERITIEYIEYILDNIHLCGENQSSLS